MAGELILVVDDNPQNLRLARMILRYAGYDVVTAADAREAIASMAAAPPALAKPIDADALAKAVAEQLARAGVR